MLERVSGAYAKKLPPAKLVYVIDFFCGCGGMSAGFVTTRQSHVAFEILAGIDINKDALDSYEKNIGAPGLCADIRELAAHPDRLRELIPGFDPEAMRPLAFIGCPPCQGFSALRKGDPRDDARNDLSIAFANLVDHFRPDIAIMENVPEVLTGRFAHHFAGATSIMEDAGYRFASDVLDFSLFGVPQRRRRAVVMAAIGHAPKLPVPIFDASQVRTVRDAIGHLRPIAAAEADADDPWHRAPAHTERLVEMFKKIPANGGDRRALSGNDKLAAHRRLDAGKTPGFTDVYGRLRWDAPSVTITAKSRSPSSGRFLHPEQHRNITVREAALLQGFPHGYIFSGPPTQQYRQVGEAVSPIFSRSLAWAVLDFLSPGDKPQPLFAEPHCASATRHDLATVDCFSGAGGLGLGFKAAGMEAVLAFDSDAAAVETYNRNLGTVAETLDVRSADMAARVGSVVEGRPHIFVGGPPCQGFSHQRRGESADPRNGLVLSYAELAVLTRPAAIILENVTDLDLPRGKDILREYCRILSEAGYTSFRHDLNSANFAVPQLRNRIIIVALPHALASLYKAPEPLTPTRWVSVGEALNDLPPPGVERANHVAAAEGAMNRQRIAFVDMGQGRKSIPIDLQLPCHASSYRGHRDVYGRLDWYSQARTLTAGFDSFTRGEYAHPFSHRSITPREAARIQGFPDWFEFVGNRAEVRRQIGNAVPPPMAFAVGRAIKAVLAQIGDIRWAA